MNPKRGVCRICGCTLGRPCPLADSIFREGPPYCSWAEQDEDALHEPEMPGEGRKGSGMNIQFYPDELDYANAKLHPHAPTVGSFLKSFLNACANADFQNYELLRPVLKVMMEKYPADPLRLAMERHDAGRSTEEDLELIRKFHEGKTA